LTTCLQAKELQHILILLLPVMAILPYEMVQTNQGSFYKYP